MLFRIRHHVTLSEESPMDRETMSLEENYCFDTVGYLIPSDPPTPAARILLNR